MVDSGFFLGFGIKLIITRKKNKKQKGTQPEVVLIIECEESQMQMVQDMLWDNNALGVSKLNLGEGV